MKRPCLSIVALVVVAACTEQPMSTVSRTQGGGKASASLAAPADPILTPVGWFDRSCVHEVPNGARMDTGGLVRRGDGSTFQLPRCMYAGYPLAQRPASGGAQPLSTTDVTFDPSIIELAWDTLPTTSYNYYTQLTAKWKVPDAPVGAYSGVQYYAAYPALWSDELGFMTIAEPTIQYGNNGEFGGSYWTMANWWTDPFAGAVHGTPDSIAAGDSILGTLVNTQCLYGICLSKLMVKDITRGDSLFDTVSSPVYNWVVGGAVQEAGITACNQYPAIGVEFSNVIVRDTSLQLSIPWIETINPNHAGPSCGFLVNAPGGYVATVELYHNRPAFSVAIGGPFRVKPDDPCTWWATPSGGVRPFTYSWTPPGSQQDSTVTEAFHQSGTLSVIAADAAYDTARASKNITVAQNGACPRVPAP